MGMVAYVTFLPALLSTGKVWGRSIRTLFLKDAIPRCSAEGEMLGRGPGGCVREGKRVFSLAGCFSPAICHICSRRGRAQAARHSPAWREQLTQLDEGQHQPSPQARPLQGDSAFPSPPGHQHDGPGSTALTGLREPSAVSPRVHLGLSACSTDRWPGHTGWGWDPSRAPQGHTGPAVLPRHCNCGQLGAVPGHRDISAMLITQAHWGRLFPDHRSVAGWDTVSTSAETLSVEHSPALPCSSFKEPGGNPLPTRSDPSQILPLSNTFLFRLRNCRSSA